MFAAWHNQVPQYLLTISQQSLLIPLQATSHMLQATSHIHFTYTWSEISETKNWRGRNETIETSGRLHPLWPQSKRLHTTWTTDYMHSGQDRWIQTKLVFTLAKNATKPNRLEIIPLQTTRKKDNRKTEKTMERATVNLEAERIKGPNPWCLWWWWCSEILSTTNQLSHLLCEAFNGKVPPEHPPGRAASSLGRRFLWDRFSIRMQLQ